MTDAPTRIYAAAKKWAKGHGPEIDWASGDWKANGKYRGNPSQEYVRADIADEMLEALRVTSELLEACTFPTAIIRGQYVDRKEAVSRASAAIAKAESDDT